MEAEGSSVYGEPRYRSTVRHRIQLGLCLPSRREGYQVVADAIMDVYDLPNDARVVRKRFKALRKKPFPRLAQYHIVIESAGARYDATGFDFRCAVKDSLYSLPATLHVIFKKPMV